MLLKYNQFSCCAVLLALCGLLLQTVRAAAAPHIIFIMADDLGWNDVSFHGSNQIPTPNLDALAYNGVILNSHYSQAICTPSRSALLTGKYPMRLGMHGEPLRPAEDRNLPEGKIMPEYFKDLGYSTYLVGKWHLGYNRWNATPTHRGFDHHFGPFNGYISYYDYLATMESKGKDYSGFDLRRDKEPAWDIVGTYATDAFTDYAVDVIQSHNVEKPLFMLMAHTAPHAGNDGKLLEAPQETINRFKYVIDSNRRTYAAMVTKIDESVGRVVEALEQKNMLANTVIVFVSDNGAPTVGLFKNWGSNYPIRGIKNTLWEGGIRTVAFAWSPLIVQTGRVSTDLVHITDWLPTLFTAAGGDIGVLDPELDGIDQWSSLVYDLPSPRNDILINIDEKTRNAALRFYNWKLIVGTVDNGTYDGYFGESGQENIYSLQYNTSAVTESTASRSIRKVSYSSTLESDFEDLRGQATLKCLNPKAKRNPCDPSRIPHKNNGAIKLNQVDNFDLCLDAESKKIARLMRCSCDGEVCLYDIPSDPCEENNLAQYFPSVVRRMKRALVDYRAGLTPQLNQEPDLEKDDPKLFDYTWNPWVDCADATCTA